MSKSENITCGKIDDLPETDTDKYKRTVALTSVDGENLNRSLLQAGYAWVYTKYCKQSYCNDWTKDEGNARNKKLDLWRNPYAMPPWEWRHKGKNKVLGQTGFYGNTRSHVFHKPDCKNCTEEFSTTDRAVMAGLLPWGCVSLDVVGI